MRERYTVFAPTWTPPEARIQICRNWDGRVFALSRDEALEVAAVLLHAAKPGDTFTAVDDLPIRME